MPTLLWWYTLYSIHLPAIINIGDVAQMVERSLSMWEVRGSIPRVSKLFNPTSNWFCHRYGPSGWGWRLQLEDQEKKSASSGNRTRAARVAGEHSTTEPTMLDTIMSTNYPILLLLCKGQISVKCRGQNYVAVGRIRTCAPRGKLISSQSP